MTSSGSFLDCRLARPSEKAAKVPAKLRRDGRQLETI